MSENQEKRQSEKSMDTAREAGCDESEVNFERALKVVAEQKPKSDKDKD